MADNTHYKIRQADITFVSTQTSCSHMRNIRFLFLILACLPAVLSHGQANSTPFDAKVKRGALPNGLKYFIVQNKKPEKKIELRMVVNAGSILEDENQQGLA